MLWELAITETCDTMRGLLEHGGLIGRAPVALTFAKQLKAAPLRCDAIDD